jgi:hypothetical protein
MSHTYEAELDLLGDDWWAPLCVQLMHIFW